MAEAERPSLDITGVLGPLPNKTEEVLKPLVEKILRETDGTYARMLSDMSKAHDILESQIERSADARGAIIRVQEDLKNVGAEVMKVSADVTLLGNYIDQRSQEVNTLGIRTAQTEEAFKAFGDAVRARHNFEETKIHWNDRANGAWWAFVLSAGVIMVLLIGVPAIAIWQSDGILHFLHRLAGLASTEVPADAGAATIAITTIGRLIIVTIPLALYFWLIRLVVKFNTRSLLLMDDARQRSTMLETYYRMIEKQAATPEERALVLQALFRPTPGHGPDTVEPPNFTEVLGHIQPKS